MLSLGTERKSGLRAFLLKEWSERVEREANFGTELSKELIPVFKDRTQVWGQQTQQSSLQS